MTDPSHDDSQETSVIARVTALADPGQPDTVAVDLLFGALSGDRTTLIADSADTRTSKPGAIVVADAASGRITRVLAEGGSARAELWDIVVHHDLDPRYPQAALDEADAIVARVEETLSDPTLEDMTTLPFVTIDNEDSRDLDQAMYISSADDDTGHTLVYYALADASYYIKAGTALFNDALARGASFYFPGFAVPMLPRVLSEGVISLNAGVLRRAFVLVMRLDEDGACVDTRFTQARIRSVAKLSYNGVQRYYDAPEESPLSGQVYTPVLDGLRRVGQTLITRAEARDVVRYNRVSVSVGFADKRGRTFVAIGEVRNDCERYNEQISLLCNIEGAEFLLAATEAEHVLIRPVFRVHPPPDPPRYGQLAKSIQFIARHHKLNPDVWHWRWRGGSDRGESLADYLERLPKDGPARPVYLAIQRQALIINNRSLFAGAPGLHHGVGAAIYARFSSPMREVVGIFTHKEALEGLAGIDDAPEDEALHAAVIAAANRSKEIQRKITKQSNQLVLDEFLGDDLALPLADRPAHSGVIIGAENGKLYVQLDAPPLEVKVYLPLVADCIGAKADTRGRGKGALERGEERVAFYLGDTIALTVHHQAETGHWCLVPERVLSWLTSAPQ